MIRVQQQRNIVAGRNFTGSTAYTSHMNDKNVSLLPYSRHILLDSKMVLLTFIVLNRTPSFSTVEPSIVAQWLSLLSPCTTYLLLICGNKMPTRCNRGFYCRSYCLLNMFRASLCPSSGAQQYYTAVAACGILCCVFFFK